MWKLKFGAEGENVDPYLFSTNKFVGRQIWEFDPHAGTPQERAEVEEARQNFYNNRYKVKASSDILWRMQVLHITYLYIYSQDRETHIFDTQCFRFSHFQWL